MPTTLTQYTVQESISAQTPEWTELKHRITVLQSMQDADGSLATNEQTLSPAERRTVVADLVADIVTSIENLRPLFPHDDDYLAALITDFQAWERNGFGVPDFLDSLQLFQPQKQRDDGLTHLVVFPMYTQNGSTNRFFEAVLVQVRWPSFIADLEERYTNSLFVPLSFIDFTPGYDTNSAVLFPESVSVRETPKFSWGAIFQDREAARFRRVLKEAVNVTGLELPESAAAFISDDHAAAQELTHNTFIMWDLIHDRTHMRGDLPFDPFMIKQRMPYFLYSLEELRCDLTAFSEAVALEHDETVSEEIRSYASSVQYAVLFDRIFRFAITGSRVRNYDGLGGQLLFAWLHQHGVLHWTDTKLSIEWDDMVASVLALSEEISTLYWRSIDRPKTVHWLAAYDLISSTLSPHPASIWAGGNHSLPLAEPPRALTDLVLDDEFPLSMFYEAFEKKMSSVIASTTGITGESEI